MINNRTDAWKTEVNLLNVREGCHLRNMKHMLCFTFIIPDIYTLLCMCLKYCCRRYNNILQKNWVVNSCCTSSVFSVLVLPVASKSEIHSTASWQLSSHVGRKLSFQGTTSDENRITLNLKSNVNIYETCYSETFTIPLVPLLWCLILKIWYH